MRKKLISLVFRTRVSETLVQSLTQDLRFVFGDSVELENIYLDRLGEKEMILGDAVLVIYPGIINRLENHVTDIKRVITITRTVTEESIYQLYDIPRGTTALIVNDTRDTTEDTVTMLYRLGIHHLNMIPYFPGETDITGIQIAVTPGEAYRVPRTIKTIIDIGNRRLDMQTFLDIFVLFRPDSDTVKQALIRYSDTILEAHTGVKSRYIRNYMLNESLKQILDIQDTGIIVTDEKFMISYWNTEAVYILKKKLEEMMPLVSCFPASIGELLVSDAFSKDLIVFGNRQFMVSKTPLVTMECVTGYCLTFESVENIRKSSNELCQKLKRQGLVAKYTFDDIIYRSFAMEHSIRLAKKAAASNYTILITGESGTGKELFAQSIHNASFRKDKPFVAVNCAALPESLLESELFGYEDGAFTGARKGGKVGLFEKADGGTIFLDEIGDMSYPLQAKLLRVLQEQQLLRLGGDSVISIDVRVLTATNQDLRQLIKEKKFREDLFYRLNVLPLHLPPLRKRREDIVPLFSFMSKIREDALLPSIRQRLEEYPWPGNVRELHNAAEYYTLMGNLECLDTGEPEAAAKGPEEIKETILEIVRTRTEKGLNTGRGSLKEELKRRGQNVGDTRLEHLLSDMCREGSILRQKGPGGIRIL